MHDVDHIIFFFFNNQDVWVSLRISRLNIRAHKNFLHKNMVIFIYQET